jgi:hypothetical protein
MGTEFCSMTWKGWVAGSWFFDSSPAAKQGTQRSYSGQEGCAQEIRTYEVKRKGKVSVCRTIVVGRFSQLKSRRQSTHRSGTLCLPRCRARRSSCVLHPSVFGPVHPPLNPTLSRGPNLTLERSPRAMRSVGMGGEGRGWMQVGVCAKLR